MKKLVSLFIVFISFSFFMINVSASSGKISISSSSTVVVGNTVTVTVTLSSSTALGAWEFNIDYDSSYLRLTSSTSENGGTYFVNYGDGKTKSKTYTLKFKALKSGTTNITVGSYDIYDWNEESMSISKSNKKLTLMTQEELEASYSKDNNLKGLTVKVGEESYDLDPVFDKDTLEYKVTVPTGTTTVQIEALKNDSTATVNGDGDIEVTEGLNTIPIVVTAQNGDEKTYTLIVNVEDQNPINVTIDGKNYTVVKSKTLLTAPVTFTESTVKINDFDIPAFVNDSLGYTLVGLKDEDGKISLYRYHDENYTLYTELNSKSYILVPVDFSKELDYIKTTADINGVKRDVYKYSEDSDFVIINAINLEDGKENLYLYDPSSGAAILFDESFIQDTNKTIENYTYVIIAFAGALFLMLILIFGLLHSTKKKQKKINQFIEKQEAKIEATRKLNDVVSEVKKIQEEEKLNKKDVSNNSSSEELKIEEVKLEETGELNQEEKQEVQEPVKKSKKELKKERKEAKRKEKEAKKKEKDEFFQDEVVSTETKIEDEIKNIEDHVTDDTEEIYDIFEDDRKKKKKK
ncbi:putative uncharacterized protein [Mycoplasma sp. CAG:776]|nr:putative uncharacterized protein [Mycoplasma sp. CAG:776]